MFHKDKSFQEKWQALHTFWQRKMQRPFTLQAALLVVALQEFPCVISEEELKDQQHKQNALHIATCFLLSEFYCLKGCDEEGWPIFEAYNDFEKLSDCEQEHHLRQAILNYFSSYLFSV